MSLLGYFNGLKMLLANLKKKKKKRKIEKRK
jgi:hypothetical protein